MDLLAHSKDFFQWLNSVLVQFLKIHAPLTIAVIAASTFGRIAGLLAFFVPLKVIILLGTEGVPPYLQSFIDAEDKMRWIVGLSIGAAGLYLLSVALDALADRWAGTGSALVLREANELTLVNKQEDVARDHFARACNACGSLLFVMIAFAGGLYLHTWTFVFLAGLIVLEYLGTALALRQHEPGASHALNAYITDQLREYLSILASINFLATFGFIVFGFFFLAADNLIVAILSILIARQILQNGTSFVSEGVRLVRQRPVTDALVFKTRTLLPSESSLMQRFRRVFASDARTGRIERVARMAAVGDASVGLKWVDSRATGLATFEWTISQQNGGSVRHWLERVYFPTRHTALEHEAFLLRHIDAETLRALPGLFSDTTDEFRSQFYDYGDGKRPDRKLWGAYSLFTIEHFLALQPPRKLQDAYFGSKSILDAAIHDDFIARMDVAVNGPRDASRMKALVAVLPEVRARIRGLPLYIYNPEIGPDHAVLYRDDDLRFDSWGRWVLEPVGYGLSLSNFSDDQLGRLVMAVRSRRDCPDEFSLSDLRLVASVARLEERIKRQSYKAALDLIPQIVQLAGENGATEPFSPRDLDAVGGV